MIDSDKKVIALCGGVGGAKLALGLSRVLSPGQLTIVVNTGDDFDHFGLPICPDLDTVMYTLGGVSNKTQGWGREGESWHAFETLKELGAETWFQLGDKDLAVHLQRRALLDRGFSLSAATSSLCSHFGIAHTVIPMSDNRVSTIIETAEGDLPFQHYFVREQCRPTITGYRFDGIESAAPSPGFTRALEDKDLAAIIICPSNPFVSVSPVIELPGVRDSIRASGVPVIAVSPIVGGKAIKGPAAKMFAELNLPVSNQGVADFYGDLLHTLVVDQGDRDEPLNTGCQVHYCNTVMKTLDEKVALARECLHQSLLFTPGGSAKGNSH
ncbi:MAG: 2-phospho-L-lactate transferase [Gammaproteobacteria bacterium BRH_c0]|nr:MAG: 2-phospho-L-lactate transferase [Gammaproteobacteria bacterium BRH_c0]